MTREAEAWAAYNETLLDIFTPRLDGELEGLRTSVRDAILAAERERTAALVAAARRVYEWGTADSIYEPEMSPDDKFEDMNGDGYFDALGVTLRAYEEGVSE